MTEVLTKESAWQEMLMLTEPSNKGWEFDERILNRLKELRPYYWTGRVQVNLGRGRTEGCKRSVPVRLTDKDGNSTVYPSKVSASQALGMRYNGISQIMRKKNFCGYIMGYKVEVLDDTV
ncbi:hypothetical protein NHG29_01715 [Aerococcaceae bacterium NML160702]|nr:hypothetical protein [Aerococcaceae bacterium NML160702]